MSKFREEYEKRLREKGIEPNDSSNDINPIQLLLIIGGICTIAFGAYVLLTV